MKELEEMGLTWGEAQTKAQKRVESRHLRRCSTHVPNLTDDKSTAKERRLNQLVRQF